MTAKEIAVELVKIWGVDAIADVSAYTAGYACDELGMPAGVSFVDLNPQWSNIRDLE